MLRFLPAVFLAGFVLELASLIWAGSVLGVGFTLLLLLASGVIGVALMRSTGLNVAKSLRQAGGGVVFSTADAGQVFLRMFAGLLLIIPGFLSDIVALLLLIQPVRRWLAARLTPMGAATYRPEQPSPFGTIIEGEAVEIKGDLPREP